MPDMQCSNFEAEQVLFAEKRGVDPVPYIGLFLPACVTGGLD
jgi:hypothetical protein